MVNDNTYDFLIIGNGILGLTTAYRLKKKQPNAKVAIIGPSDRPGCASLVAGAMTNVWAEISEGLFEDPVLAERFELTLNGAQGWKNFAKEISEYSDAKVEVTEGTYLILNSKSTDIEVNSFNYIKKILKEKNVPHKNVLPSQIDWFKPDDNCRAFEILEIPDGRVDSKLAINALDRAMEALGVNFYKEKAVGLKASSGWLSSKEHEVTLESNTVLKSQNVILASGAFSQTLVDQVRSLKNEVPRLLFGGGAGLDLEFPAWVHKYGGMGREIFDMNHVIRTTDRGGACGLHVVPYGGGRYFVGAASGVWTEPDLLPKIHGVHNLVHGVLTEISRAFFFAGVSLRGNGFRPTSADTLPLIGESNIKGIWYLNGTKRDGFTMSPYLSDLITDALLGKENKLPKRFQPARKLISFKSKDQAIKSAELMYIGSDYQHGGSVVPYMVDSYRNMRRKQIEDVYTKRKIQEFGIHPEVLHLYENDDFFKLIDHPREKN